MTLAAGLCLPLVSLRLPSPVVSPCLPVSPSLLVSQSMRSDARCCLPLVSLCLDACCDAGCGVVSPTFLPASPVSRVL